MGFGDIAIAVGCGFTRYLDTVMNSLKLAASITIDTNDIDQIDYQNELCENILCALTSIIHGLKGENDSPQVYTIGPHIPFITELIKKVSVDDERTEAITLNSCGLVGDLITALVTNNNGQNGSQENYALGLYQCLNNENVKKMLTEARASNQGKVKQMASWALREFKKMRQGVENVQNNNNNNQINMYPSPC